MKYWYMKSLNNRNEFCAFVLRFFIGTLKTNIALQPDRLSNGSSVLPTGLPTGCLYGCGDWL